MNIFVTGRAGLGKTTVIRRAVEELDGMGYRHGGICTPEIRVNGARVGFRIIDLATGKSGILAHVNNPSGPKIGHYRVNLYDVQAIGVNAIREAIKNADYIVIDEVGPMELLSKEFRDAVLSAVECPKPVLGALHWKRRDWLLKEVKDKYDVRIHRITPQNRESLHRTLVEEIVKSIEGVGH